VVIVDQDGEIVASLGEPSRVIYPRSAVKPFQAVGLLRLGVPLHGSELALASASHSGEPFHIDGVRRILDAAGLGPEDLQCPADLPYDDTAREAYLRSGGERARIVMNCSGKHAAMLWACRINGFDTATYLEPDHEMQKTLKETIAHLSGENPDPVSTDGCGAPLWGLPLVGLARGMVALAADGHGARVAEALRAYPEFSGGSTRDVTHLMRAVPGLVAKDGAEAVQAMVYDDGQQRFGIALKVADGSQRARPIVAAAALARLGVRTPVIDEHLRGAVLGGGRPVGWASPSAALAEFASV
jgi:L-asparaginase II